MIQTYYILFNRGRYLRPIFLTASTLGTVVNFHYQIIREVDQIVRTDIPLGNVLRDIVNEIYYYQHNTPNYSNVTADIVDERLKIPQE